ncbi:MAG TPA: HD domain-containing protein [Candidatus Paceibacterota bacterium]|nr:HD domain-containing protein [Candidatus Paceibacterota bacterium]
MRGQQSQAEEMVAAAREFAKKAHEGLKRPNKAQDPYWTHLKDVADLVEAAGGTPWEIAAAWLHDTVEDTSTTLEEIRVIFGAEVAHTVDGLTDPPHFTGMPTLERKTLQAQRVVHKDKSVKLVKLADQTSNVRSVTSDPPVDWTPQKCRDYIDGARLIAEECKDASPVLYVEFCKAYKAADRIYPKSAV